MNHKHLNFQEKYNLARLGLDSFKSDNNEKSGPGFFYILLLCLVSSASFADVKPLFYETYNFSEDDALAVREQPRHTSKKLRKLAVGSRLEVLECRHLPQSKWCKVEDIHFPGATGWVNAKYIKPVPHQEGYVTIEGKKNNCYYVLKCEEKNQAAQCLVVTYWRVDSNDNDKVTLQTEWFDRNRLHAASSFSAMLEEPGADGYCISDKIIDGYRTEGKLK